ncbi:hypothetical protein ISF_04723 [Cordyceps fumosorosea ARSEF 2679]|uniref:Uncharacterized protein n=1 Tax=Cordyceps fumosorosea (strain ARSEF 2679) TaxID=1081104 RepID=A0A167WNK5_CORFA|nr:hypothetical protein ISF_04723 [Cordyceps fumosorosea ARSEF 2679]OAA64014.1 hypothetical protein ISF_04723 [Cordyceps fumosorosea ARSEF 2679]
MDHNSRFAMSLAWLEARWALPFPENESAYKFRPADVERRMVALESRAGGITLPPPSETCSHNGLAWRIMRVQNTRKLLSSKLSTGDLRECSRIVDENAVTALSIRYAAENILLTALPSAPRLRCPNPDCDNGAQCRDCWIVAMQLLGYAAGHHSFMLPEDELTHSLTWAYARLLTDLIETRLLAAWVEKARGGANEPEECDESVSQREPPLPPQNRDKSKYCRAERRRAAERRRRAGRRQPCRVMMIETRDRQGLLIQGTPRSLTKPKALTFPTTVQQTLEMVMEDVLTPIHGTIRDLRPSQPIEDLRPTSILILIQQPCPTKSARARLLPGRDGPRDTRHITAILREVLTLPLGVDQQGAARHRGNSQTTAANQNRAPSSLEAAAANHRANPPAPAVVGIPSNAGSAFISAASQAEESSSSSSSSSSPDKDVCRQKRLQKRAAGKALARPAADAGPSGHVQVGGSGSAGHSANDPAVGGPGGPAVPGRGRTAPARGREPPNATTHPRAGTRL